MQRLARKQQKRGYSSFSFLVKRKERRVAACPRSLGVQEWRRVHACEGRAVILRGGIPSILSSEAESICSQQAYWSTRVLNHLPAVLEGWSWLVVSIIQGVPLELAFYISQIVLMLKPVLSWEATHSQNGV